MRPTGSQQRNGEREIDIERERETERETEGLRDGERIGVGIMCGETPRELETLEREI